MQYHNFIKGHLMKIKTSVQLCTLLAHTFFATQAHAYTQETLKYHCEDIVEDVPSCVSGSPIQADLRALYNVCIHLSVYQLADAQYNHLYKAKSGMREAWNKTDSQLDQWISKAENLNELADVIFEHLLILKQSATYDEWCKSLSANHIV